MTYKNVVFYQSSFGQAASLKVSDLTGATLYDDSIPLGEYQSSTNANAPAGIQDLPQVGYRLNVIGPSTALDGKPEINNVKLKSGEMYVQLVPIGPNAATQEIQGAVVGQGDSVRIGNIDVTFLRERRFTVLQVASNPGIPVFWTAAVLLVLGLAITFYFPHRRIRAIIGSNNVRPGTTVVKMAPLAKRDWSGQRDFFRCIDTLQTRLGVTPIVKGRQDHPSSAEATA
jgi:cytochrome c biogenesis protein